MPTRQARRKADRDAAKRAPAQARAAAAAGAAAALANLGVNPGWTMQVEDPYVGLGPGAYKMADSPSPCLGLHVISKCRELRNEGSKALTRRPIYAWPDPSALLDALGADEVKLMADEGGRAAQFSQGCLLIGEVKVLGADGEGLSDAAYRSPKVEVGLAHQCTFLSLAIPRCGDASIVT